MDHFFGVRLNTTFSRDRRGCNRSNNCGFSNKSFVNAHTNGTDLIVPITSMHTVKYKTHTNRPATGSIVFSFPKSLATDGNRASLSGATFGATCGSFVIVTKAGQQHMITCNLSASNFIARTAVTLLKYCCDCMYVSFCYICWDNAFATLVYYSKVK